jgi:capsular exopolysaccharide synthesis family protein
LDRSIKTPDDVEEELGLTFLGLLPEISANGKEPGRRYGRRRVRQQEIADAVQRTPELMAHYDSGSGLAEASRAIRTNLMFMAPDKPFRRLLVTSAGPSEGKTMVACCVAVAMAQAGQRVLLVDCDLRRPRLHRIFRVNNDVGVTSAMLDHSLINSSTIRTEVENLDVMSAGPHAPNPAELLQSESFLKLLGALQERYDRVVLDSPPVVPVTDPAVLSKHVDGTLLVIRAFKTTRDLTRQAVRSLRDVNAPMVGAILNAVDLSRREYGYYHYYYYKSEGYRSAAKVASA